MSRHSHEISRHCSAQWKRPRCFCTREGDHEHGGESTASGFVNLQQLRLSLLLVFLAFVTSSSFPVAIVASSTSSTIPPAPRRNSTSSSSALVQHFQSTSNRRGGGRFSTMEETQLPIIRRRRLVGQYTCRWKPNICEQEPIIFLLGPDCCNSVCTNLKIDVFNCGTCGHICFYGSICCNGICTDIFNDNRNCGACDSICPLGETCEFGLCGYT